MERESDSGDRNSECGEVNCAAKWKSAGGRRSGGHWGGGTLQQPASFCATTPELLSNCVRRQHPHGTEAGQELRKLYGTKKRESCDTQRSAQIEGWKITSVSTTSKKIQREQDASPQISDS